MSMRMNIAPMKKKTPGVDSSPAASLKHCWAATKTERVATTGVGVGSVGAKTTTAEVAE